MKFILKMVSGFLVLLILTTIPRPAAAQSIMLPTCSTMYQLSRPDEKIPVMVIESYISPLDLRMGTFQYMDFKVVTLDGKIRWIHPGTTPVRLSAWVSCDNTGFNPNNYPKSPLIPPTPVATSVSVSNQVAAAAGNAAANITQAPSMPALPWQGALAMIVIVVLILLGILGLFAFLRYARKEAAKDKATQPGVPPIEQWEYGFRVLFQILEQAYKDDLPVTADLLIHGKFMGPENRRAVQDWVDDLREHNILDGDGLVRPGWATNFTKKYVAATVA